MPEDMVVHLQGGLVVDMPGDMKVAMRLQNSSGFGGAATETLASMQASHA